MLYKLAQWLPLEEKGYSGNTSAGLLLSTHHIGHNSHVTFLYPKPTVYLRYPVCFGWWEADHIPLIWKSSLFIYLNGQFNYMVSINNNINNVTTHGKEKKIKMINKDGFEQIQSKKFLFLFSFFLAKFWTTTVFGWSMWSIRMTHRHVMVMSVMVSFSSWLGWPGRIAFVCAHVTSNIWLRGNEKTWKPNTYCGGHSEILTLTSIQCSCLHCTGYTLESYNSIHLRE